jgi:hypothetical protein
MDATLLGHPAECLLHVTGWDRSVRVSARAAFGSASPMELHSQVPHNVASVFTVELPPNAGMEAHSTNRVRNASVLPTASPLELHPVPPERVLDGGSASGHPGGDLDERQPRAVELSRCCCLGGSETPVTSCHASTTQDIRHGFTTDAELVRKPANGEATFISRHEVINKVRSRSTVDLLGGAGFRLPGCSRDGFQDRTDKFSLVSVA